MADGAQMTPDKKLGDGNITKDAMYDAVASGRLRVDARTRPLRSIARAPSTRSSAATHDHFWDPLDKKYIDFSEPFDLENQALMPEEMFPALQTAYVQNALKDPKDKIRFINESTRWSLSSILHGEQGALNLSASLCHVLKDQGAQEYAANQAREEARHVTAFAQYIKARWGTPMPVGPVLKNLLVEIIGAPEVYKKIVGMQMLVEGLAMGAFATFFTQTHDPLMKKLMQLVMTDEAFHHKFGKIWADRTVPKLEPAELAIVEDWAAHCFQTLLFNLVAPHQQKPMYESFGLDVDKVVRRAAGHRHRRGAPRGDEGSHQHLPGADQDPAQRRHHHRPHPRLLRHVCRHGGAEARRRPHGRRRHCGRGDQIPADDQLPPPFGDLADRGGVGVG